MDAKEIIDSVNENDLDGMKTKVNQALAEKAQEALQARKVELGQTYFTPKVTE